MGDNVKIVLDDEQIALIWKCELDAAREQRRAPASRWIDNNGVYGLGFGSVKINGIFLELETNEFNPKIRLSPSQRSEILLGFNIN